MAISKILTIASLVPALLLSVITVHAYELSTGGSTTACISLQYDLEYLLTDTQTNGEVSKLQAFLISKGLLASGNAIGKFGPATFAAVKDFQSKNGLPSTGIVGPKTREIIKTSTCANSAISSTATNGTSSGGDTIQVQVLNAILDSSIATTKNGALSSLKRTLVDETDQILQTAKYRHQIMKFLASTDPSAFLGNVIPETKRSKFSSAVQEEIEMKVTVTGKIEVIHSDDFKNPKNSTFSYFLKVGSAKYSLKSAGKMPAMTSGSSVKVRAYQIDKTLVTYGGTSDVAVLSEPILDSVGTQKMLAILVTSQGYPATPSTQEMYSRIFTGQFKSFYDEQSYGKVSFEGGVTDWISIAPYQSYCYGGATAPIDLNTPAIHDYLIQHNINLSQYGRIVFILNNDVEGVR